MSPQEPRIRPDQWWVRGVKAFWALAAFALLLLALSSGFLRGLPSWQSWELFVRIGMAVAAFAVALLLFRSRRGRLATDEPVNKSYAMPYPKFLDELWRDAARRITSAPTAPASGRAAANPSRSATGQVGEEYGAQAADYLQPIAVFVELTISPAKHRVRVAERIDLEGRLMMQRVTVEFDLPAGWERVKFLYLPVLHPVKGELVDNFHLRDADDGSLADLTYEETTRLAGAGLRLLMALGHKTLIEDGQAASATSISTDGSLPKADEWPDNVSRDVQKALLALLSMRGHVEIAAAERRVDELIETLTDVDELTKERLRRYVVELCGAYPIVAVVDPSRVVGGRVVIKYERALQPTSLSALGRGPRSDPWWRRFGGVLRRWRGLARILLGVRPSQVLIPISLALTASSYHLRLNAPDSKYVFEQHLECQHCRRLVAPNWDGADSRLTGCSHVAGAPVSGQGFDGRHYFRLQRRRGQNFVHLYMRHFGAMEPKMYGLRLVARFKEVPPGSRMQAAITALATAVLITIVGYLVSEARLSPGSDYPAVILALPAVVAPWFGIAAERNALVGGSLLARVSLIVSGVLSMASIVTYLITAPREGEAVRPVVDSTVSLLGITHPAWVILSTLSLANFVYVYYRFALKLVHYRDLLGRTHGPGTAAEFN